MSTSRDVAAVLARLVDRKVARGQVVRPALVRGRNTDGTTQLEHLDGTCVARGTREPANVGSVVTLPASDLRSRGAAGLGANARGQLDALWLERLEPRVLHPGDIRTVQAHGRGFVAGTRFDLLLAEGVFVNPVIDVLAVRVLSSTLAEIDVRVQPSAPLLRGGAVAYGRAA